MSQDELFRDDDPVATAVEERIRTAQQRGQCITPWIRDTLYSWAARGVKPLEAGAPGRLPRKVNAESQTYMELGVLPTPCDCTECEEPALIFPPEEGAPTGYCICPCCSFKGCPHKEPRAQEAP